MIPQLLSSKIDLANSHILDVGCADGHNSIELHKLGAQVSSIEIDQDLVNKFTDEASQLGISLIQCDANKMPYEDESFDAAILIEVFEHFDDPLIAMGEIARVIRPGGVVLVGLPTAYTEKFFSKMHPEYLHNATHIRIYERAEVESVIEKAGLKVVAVSTQNLAPAISWFFHSILRSKSEHTGEITQHLWVDSLLRYPLGAWKRLPILNLSFKWCSDRVGKSWYFICEK